MSLPRIFPTHGSDGQQYQPTAFRLHAPNPTGSSVLQIETEGPVPIDIPPKLQLTVKESRNLRQSEFSIFSLYSKGKFLFLEAIPEEKTLSNRYAMFYFPEKSGEDYLTDEFEQWFKKHSESQVPYEPFVGVDIKKIYVNEVEPEKRNLFSLKSEHFDQLPMYESYLLDKELQAKRDVEMRAAALEKEVLELRQAHNKVVNREKVLESALKTEVAQAVLYAQQAEIYKARVDELEPVNIRRKERAHKMTELLDALTLIFNKANSIKGHLRLYLNAKSKLTGLEGISDQDVFQAEVLMVERPEEERVEEEKRIGGGKRIGVEKKEFRNRRDALLDIASHLKPLICDLMGKQDRLSHELVINDFKTSKINPLWYKDPLAIEDFIKEQYEKICLAPQSKYAFRRLFKTASKILYAFEQMKPLADYREVESTTDITDIKYELKKAGADLGGIEIDFDDINEIEETIGRELDTLIKLIRLPEKYTGESLLEDPHTQGFLIDVSEMKKSMHSLK